MKPTEVPQTYDDARLAAREMAASPWCAALVRELGAGADLRESLEWIFALAIRAGQSIEETKLEAERIGVTARRLLTDFAGQGDQSPADTALRAMRVISDLYGGQSLESTIERLALFVNDRAAYQAARAQEEERYYKWAREALYGPTGPARLDAVAAARAADMMAQMVLAEENPAPRDYASVEWVLQRRAKTGDALAAEALGQRPEWRDRFARKLLERARVAWRIVSEAPLPQSADEAIRTTDTDRGPVLWVDAQLAEMLATMGSAGEEAAGSVLEEAAARFRGLRDQLPLPGQAVPWGELWELWHPPAERFVDNENALFYRYLAQVVWLHEVRPQIKGEREKYPAIVGPLFAHLARVQTPGGRVVPTERGDVLVDREGVFVAEVTQPLMMRIAAVRLQAIPSLMQRGAGLLGSLNAHRLMRWMVPKAHYRMLAKEQDARVLVVDGGWSALAEEIHAGGSKKAPTELCAITTAFAHLAFPMPDGSVGNFLAYTDRPAIGQRSARLEIVVGTALLPNETYQFPRGDRALVPMIDLPPLVGRPNDHGAQAALQLYILAELRKRATELVETGGVAISDGLWNELSAGAGVPVSIRGKVLEAWTSAEGFLLEVDRRRYTLADTHRDARDFLIAGGESEIAGAKAGRAGASRKRKRLERWSK